MMLSSIASTGIPTTAASYVSPVRSSAQAVQNGAGSAATNTTSASAAASSSANVTSSDIQSDVNGINALIQGVAQTVWSRIPGITSEQIANTQNTAYKNIQGAEGSIIAQATHFGIVGVSFNFDPINATASSPENEISASQINAPAGTSAADTTVATSSVPSPRLSSLSSFQQLTHGGDPASTLNVAPPGNAGATTKSGADVVALDVLAALNDPVFEPGGSAFTAKHKINTYA